MKLELYTSAFCGPCHAARAAVDEASRLVPDLRAVDLDVAAHSDEAEARDIRSTPTIVLTNDAGDELFRAAGAPSLPQLLTAVAAHLQTV
ncbi:thioredoxin [Frondihabitans sp. PAMC 28766]|uniref:thioredoxin family protein n=1 Tax=Frondihabitans sp. PAMC 28766 TaxID=1795630 RepID=UPI00078D9E9D|nr:thioredoxin family protein [Frondihabitans sp. PAMC 28766]AMM20379.1 thioredoxin [Frondihabitans sp. PAMC 28766]